MAHNRQFLTGATYRPEIAAALLPKIVSAAAGLAGPVLLGTLLGQPRIGMMVSLGGLSMGTVLRCDSFRKQIPGLSCTVAAGTLAILVGSAVGELGTAALVAMIIISGLAALIGGISRPLARGSVLFVLFLIIAAHLGAGRPHAVALTFLFFSGAIGTVGIFLLMRLLCGFILGNPPPSPGETKIYSAQQLLRRWRKSLLHVSGWRYTLRITVCLTAAGIYSLFLSHHHGYWALVTVAIVVHRDLHTALQRTLQRATGTVIGVLIAGVLALWAPSNWAVITAIGVLAASRPILVERNYTAYSVVQTPLVILLLDFGRLPSLGVVYDRLAATLAGCATAVLFGYLGWDKLPASVPPRQGRKVIG
jgi:hypothetical protein